jgi:rhamnogalacturonyl hydrolase YesR
MNRRQAFGCLAALGASAEPLPKGVAAVIANTLKQAPGSLNTDWFGTLLVKGLLEWARRGVPGAGDFARRWFEHHLNSAGVAPYSGIRGSRVVRVGGIPITMYAGHFGLSFPCYELAQQFGDSRARQVCLDMASVILHQAARNRLGLVLHDDISEFTIPDVCYFVVVPLMIAASLDPERGRVYRDQAVFQLRTSIDTFLDRDTGLAKTILLKSGLGKTYWTRASGWLAWAITGVLRHLAPDDPAFKGFAADLAVLAGGVARTQDASGGLRVLVNDSTTPLETSGTLMCAMAFHEAIRKRWLPATVAPFVDRAWAFVRGNITADGDIRRVYTLWAVPAEAGQIEMDHVKMGWIPGFVLSASNEMIA